MEGQEVTLLVLSLVVSAVAAMVVAIIRTNRDARAAAAELAELTRSTDELERLLHHFDRWDEHVAACERFERYGLELDRPAPEDDLPA
jgi:hypothetical protein